MTKRRDDIVGRCKKRNPFRIFIPRHIPPPCLFSSGTEFHSHAASIREISSTQKQRSHPRAASHGISVERAYRKLSRMGGRGGGGGGGEERRSVAFYALNVHSEVDRRWKRQSGRFPPSFLRFCRGDRSSCDRRTGSGGCSPLPSSAEWLASLVKRDKNLGRYISAGCVDTNVRILICEGSPLLLPPPPLPPRFVALGPPPYIYCETFFGHVSHRPIPSSLKVLFPRRYWEEKESGCPVSKENR